MTDYWTIPTDSPSDRQIMELEVHLKIIRSQLAALYNVLRLQSEGLPSGHYKHATDLLADQLMGMACAAGRIVANCQEAVVA